MSHQDHARVTVESLVDGVDLAEPLTRAEFEELNHDLFLKVVEHWSWWIRRCRKLEIITWTVSW